MLLDEPSSGLDVHETEQLGDALRRVREERGTAFVLVEHNVEFVLGLSGPGHGARLRQGALVRGHPDEIRNSPEVQAAYFGAPVDGRGRRMTTVTEADHVRPHRHGRRCSRSPTSRSRTARRARCSACRSTCRGIGHRRARRQRRGQVVARLRDRGRRVAERGHDHVRRSGHHRPKRAHGLQARARLRARDRATSSRTSSVRDNLWAQLRFTRAARRRARRRSTARSRCSRSWPSGGASRPARCRAASSRCSRSPACSPRRRSCSSPTRCRSGSRR